jgi:hypothetical protein
VRPGAVTVLLAGGLALGFCAPAPSPPPNPECARETTAILARAVHSADRECERDEDCRRLPHPRTRHPDDTLVVHASDFPELQARVRSHHANCLPAPDGRPERDFQLWIEPQCTGARCEAVEEGLSPGE